jgi:hypothetical protein
VPGLGWTSKITPVLSPLEWQHPRRHLVEHHSEREQVGSASSSLARTCSGDMYAIVPTATPALVRDSSKVEAFAYRVRVGFGLDRKTLASPKSRTFACPRLVTKMFAGLMSRCTMPLAVCAASSASAMWTPSDPEFNSLSMRTCRQCRCFSVMPVQKLHGDERLRRAGRRRRKSCKCSGWFSAEAASASRSKAAEQCLRVFGYVCPAGI